MKRGLAAAVVLSSFAFTVGSAPAKQTKTHACTWGASSITAQYVNGKLVESKPVTTGCVP